MKKKLMKTKPTKKQMKCNKYFFFLNTPIYFRTYASFVNTKKPFYIKYVVTTIALFQVRFILMR